MTVISQFITFLQENKKLQERGIQNIFNERLKDNFLWINDLEYFINQGVCSSVLPLLFIDNLDKVSDILVFPKPNFKIPSEYTHKISFDEYSQKFIQINDSTSDLEDFLSSEVGQALSQKLDVYRYTQKAYSKLYKVHNDLEGDSLKEYVLSVGLLQYSRKDAEGKVIKYNQHLFHFPLKTEVGKNGTFKVSFSDDAPYVDFSFLNNTTVTKSMLIEIVDVFNKGIVLHGYEYLFEDEFKELIHRLVTISDESELEENLSKPLQDVHKTGVYRITYSPALNDKVKRPRYFEKLTESIIEYSDENQFEGELLNFLLRNPEFEGRNHDPKPNYFREELFQSHADVISNLKQDEDFSVFFPLAFNQEQRQIYENFLQNRLTVVTGPPGTGKSHTIVNILCTLLAQGKRVLVTAQTDKALESLLEKIPPAFDNLVFTKIQLENNKNRFSLEKSIGNITSTLTQKLYFDIKDKIKSLDNFKYEQVALKRRAIEALESEYKILNINDSFKNLRPYQIIEKFETKDRDEWIWIEDIVTLDFLENFDEHRECFLKIESLRSNLRQYGYSEDFDALLNDLDRIDLESYLIQKTRIKELEEKIGLSDTQFSKIDNIDLVELKKTVSLFKESNYVVTDIFKVERLLKQIDYNYRADALSLNRNFSDIVKNSDKYLADIDIYLSHSGSEKVSILTRNLSSSFKSVQYLETFQLDGKPSATGVDILRLKDFIEALMVISRNFNILKDCGYSVFLDEKSNISEKSIVLFEALETVEKNRKILESIDENTDLLIWSQIIGEGPTQVDKFRKKSYLYLDDLDNYKKLRKENQILENQLIEIEKRVFSSPFRDELLNYLPLHAISDFDRIVEVKKVISVLVENRSKEKEISELSQSLNLVLPKLIKDFDKAKKMYFTKENFEFAFASQSLESSFEPSADFQLNKENLNALNNKVFEIKCDILYNLALKNFKDRFNDLEADKFLNLLNEYKHNFTQSRRGIKNKTKYQNLTKKNSEEISQRLSCWVMSFNDVLASLSNQPEVFDCIIVDEASQIDFNGLLLGYYSKSMIIVGDDMQTSPSPLTGVDSRDFDTIKQKYLSFLGGNTVQIDSANSLFNLAQMVAGRSNIMLKEHFRCVPEIIEFSKFHFYENQIRPLKQKKTNGLLPKKGEFVENAFSDNGIVKREMDKIEEYIGTMIDDPQYANKSIGVVSLGPKKHTESLKYLKGRLVNNFGLEKIDSIKLIVSDASKFQGDERDVMIISLGVGIDAKKTLENQDARPNAIRNDLESKRKINVAMSRAKEQMILFHSLRLEDLKEGDFRKDIVNFFYEELKTIPALVIPDSNEVRSRYNVPKPFDSWFEIDVAKGLVTNGFYHVQPQYKVKEAEFYYNPKTGKEHRVNFKLDLVVHVNTKMIAIECDGDPFHSEPDDVFYDIERQEFLERVGWKVYRILYSEFRKQPFEEIQKMINFIKKNS